jgi:hypothetical protein
LQTQFNLISLLHVAFIYIEISSWLLMKTGVKHNTIDDLCGLKGCIHRLGVVIVNLDSSLLRFDGYLWRLWLCIAQ